MDAGLLIARLVFGLLIAAHGAQKLFGWFGGYGLDAVSTMFDGIGFRPSRPFAFAASTGETLSGVLIAAGLLGPIGPAVMLAVMIVAATTVHWPNGLFAMSNGIELPLLYATAGAALTLTGPGRYSTDALAGIAPLWTPAVAWVVLAAAIVAGVIGVAMRRPAPVAA